MKGSWSRAPSVPLAAAYGARRAAQAAAIGKDGRGGRLRRRTNGTRAFGPLCQPHFLIARVRGMVERHGHFRAPAESPACNPHDHPHEGDRAHERLAAMLSTSPDIRIRMIVSHQAA
ncbi:hypothetical protein [Burkholderia thailandensis]|uniref:hypothetical protein n=1 Tax=Burkholderia thailandensis TaxID=57975 RepID=UPI0012B6784B|nr:hypothetical protein [Burkholderia thailandensis]MBS2130885.1 hypothetical protein [Burkholderia thailandensis]MCS3399962.1 hypothetical protein [Burkholderia thailandensis]MCS6470648.1 hypothetical protein [Burkholderia thailandensis]MCS6477749.1 hypothetical protein [Burkholderia thailandensis]MCS6494192.1 hypothetical protein [Burkholderia thailandensis]